MPTWLQIAPQVGVKTYQKSDQEPSKLHSKLHLIFDHFLDRFLMDFWWIFDPQSHTEFKSEPNNACMYACEDTLDDMQATMCEKERKASSSRRVE